MSKIRYAVIGIDPQTLGNLIGTLARGEVEGDADTVVLPAIVPTVFSIGESANGPTVAREVPFNKFLGDAVTKERRRLVEASPGAGLVEDVKSKLLLLNSKE